MIDGFERIGLCFYVLVIPSGFLKNNFLQIQQHFLSTHSGTWTYPGKPVMKAQTALAPNQFKCHVPRWSSSEPFRSCIPPLSSRSRVSEHKLLTSAPACIPSWQEPGTKALSLAYGRAYSWRSPPGHRISMNVLSLASL